MKKFILAIIFLLFPSLCFGMGCSVLGGSAGGVSEFKFTILTLEEDDTFTLPIYNGGSYDFNVNWGDGSNDNITAYNDAAVTHTYEDSGATEYTVTITGTITGWSFNNTGENLLRNNISSWGPLNLGNNSGYFYGCTNLTVSATDTLDLTGTTNMAYMFYGCSAFNQSVAAFDTSSVTNMSYMFYGCSAFNQSVDSFDTSSVTNMYKMFYNCTNFNQSVAGLFDTSSVTNMSNMFFGCSAFNQSVAAFDTSSVTDMAYMFYGCSAFDQSLAVFDTSSVTNMSNMFFGCSAFDQSVDSFDTSLVTNMSYMFYGCSAFDQSLAVFDTSSVTNMYKMFYNCSAFDQSVDSFDTSLVTNMYQMFYGCSAFNQDLSGFDIEALVAPGASDMLTASSFSTTNYDLLLVAWEAQAEPVSIVFSAGSTTYTGGGAVAAARAQLVLAIGSGGSGWTITDGGESP